MLITHKIRRTKTSKNVQDILKRNNSLFLVDRHGHYLFLPANPKEQLSNYQGWVHVAPEASDFSMYKIIDNIRINHDPNELINKFTSAERRSRGIIESFSLVRDSMIYRVKGYTGKVYIDLDFRGMYDYDDSGRIYNINMLESRDVVLVEYIKHTGNDLSKVNSMHYLAIRGIKAYSVPGKWTRRIYNYDSLRGARSEFYVYEALEVDCKKNIDLIFSFSNNRDEAIAQVTSIDISKHDALSENYIDNVLSLKTNISKEIGTNRAMAYTNCVHALNCLSINLDFEGVKCKGLWAGLPWFHQYWARDELISSYSLLLEHHYDYAKGVIMKYTLGILNDGRLANRYPKTELGNADGIGWLFKRLDDFLRLCEQRDNFDMYFTLRDLQTIRERLEFSINALVANHSKDGLIINNNLETWIDSSFEGEAYERDFRAGARIEIQALFLGMLRFMNQLNNYLSNKFVKKGAGLVRDMRGQDDRYVSMEREFRENVKAKFFVQIGDSNVLNDGYDCEMSDVVRPNIFLAYYIYPELLSSHEWENAFDYALQRLWCDWSIDSGAGGGLSTIDKSNPLYHPHDTGQNNRSYHRGDTWFWINNIAAISMYRLNKEKYKGYIEKVLDASVEDILFCGFAGYASEIASSYDMTPAGCFCQTWSIATFIELIHEMYIE